MRKFLVPILLGLGAFLLIAAVVAQVWAPGQVERTPLDTDNTTQLSGDARVASGPDLELQRTAVLAWSGNKVDSDASTDEVAVWLTSLCVVRDEGGIDGCVRAQDPRGRLITAETDVFATDRHTALTVPNDGYVPEGTPQQEGLQNKWPFGAQKTTYPVWDGVVGSSVDARYTGTDEIDGLAVYVYRADARAAGVVVVGEDVMGSYAQTTDYYIEPRTGAIIDQVVHQVRVARGVGRILDLNLSFTDDQVQTNVDDARTNIDTLRLIEDIVPLVGYVVGGLAVAVGIVLLVVRRRRPVELETPPQEIPEESTV